MLATSSWIYLDLEKTGSTFVRSVLQDLYSSSSFLASEKHSLMDENCSRSKILTIRDPRDYYFSLWRFGLDARGGIYKSLSKLLPRLSEKIYACRSPEGFSAFLDFMLHTPARYPNASRLSWLPLGFDLYTARILSMIVPVKSRQSFLDALGPDYLAVGAIIEAALPYRPNVLLRTCRLNSDFHKLATSGQLDFMDLPPNWGEKFSLSRPPLNTSPYQSLSIDSFLLPGWSHQLECKSCVASWLFQCASDQFVELA